MSANITLAKALYAKVDAWSNDQSDRPTRSEAVRRLLELGLLATPTRKMGGKQKMRLLHLAIR